MRAYTALVYVILGLSILASQGCSSGVVKETETDPKGPTILTAHSEPGTVQLNLDLQPIHPVRILADVKDFNSEVTTVTLRFDNVPVTVVMENVGGNTWEAKISPHELEMMAVSGQTVKYGAQIIAKNSDGKIGMSQKPVEISISAPKLAQSAEM